MSTPTVDLTRGRLNILSTVGDDVALPLTLQENGVAPDLTGRTFLCQLRRDPASAVVVTVTVDTAQAASGILTLRLTAAVTAPLTGTYVWELQQTTAGVIRTLLGGAWQFVGDVARP